MTPKEISDILNSVFSNGYKTGGITVLSKSPLVANISNNKNFTTIKFEQNQPKIAIKRLITFYVYVEEIVLGTKSGSIKLRNFPDMNFNYENGASVLSFFKENFSSNNDIVEAIEKKYKSKKQQKIANRCLHYADEWATIVGSSHNFADISECEKKNLKSECYKFVVENVKNDIEQEYGSVILTYLLVFIIIPAIARFIITKLLEKYF